MAWEDQRTYQLFAFTKRQIWLLDFLTCGVGCCGQTDKSHESAEGIGQKYHEQESALVKVGPDGSQFTPQQDSEILQLHNFRTFWDLLKFSWLTRLPAIMIPKLALGFLGLHSMCVASHIPYEERVSQKERK